MNKLIGITGGMSSGKTTISNEIINLNPDYVYIDVDEIRRHLFYNRSFALKLKKIIPELKDYTEINSLILNKYIYHNNEYMKKYKELLYRYLFNYLDGFYNKTILIDWALILNDNLQDKFDKIVYVDASDEVRLERLKNSDLSKEDILKRFELQRINNLNEFISDKFLIVNNDKQVDINQINNFLSNMECKFTKSKS